MYVVCKYTHFFHT